MKWYIVQDGANGEILGIVRERNKKLAAKKAKSATTLMLYGLGYNVDEAKWVVDELQLTETKELRWLDEEVDE